MNCVLIINYHRIFLPVLLLFASLLCSSQDHFRVKGSPYPFSAQPDTLFLVSENISYAEKISLHSLMGLTAKTKARLLRDVSNHKQLAVQAGMVVIDSFYQDYNSLLQRFAPGFSGYILCRSKDHSTNVAISLSAVLNAVVIPEEIETLAKNAGLKKKLDVRGKNEKWALRKYGDAFNKDIASYQNASEERGAYLGDYSIFTGALQFWDKRSTGSLAKKVYRRMNSGAAFFGAWPDEYKTVEQLSKHSLMVHASDWACNLSTLTNIRDTVIRIKQADSFAVVPNVHTVCFVMSDGDNIQWLLNAFNDTNNWNSSLKTRLSLGWTISPALTELAPVVYNQYVNLLSSTKGSNGLVASPSGRGYFFPSLYSDLEKENLLLNEYLGRTGMRIVNLIDRDKGNFSEKAYLSQPNIDALFLYSFGSNYTGRKGKITWYNDKPCIGGRFALWEGASTPEELVAMLNKASTDIHSQDGYSLIPVHVWSRGVKEVMACVQQLNPQVRVVSPEEFVWLIRKTKAH